MIIDNFCQGDNFITGSGNTVAVFVLEANFHPSQPRLILIVRTPPVAISVRAVIGARSPIATYGTVLAVLVHHSPHTVPVHATHAVVIALSRAIIVALLRPPTATDLN